MKMKLCMMEIKSIYELMNENNSIMIKENSLYLEGFQAYIVLDWVTDRTRLCKTIAVYTGNPEHKIHVCSVCFLSPNKEDYSGTIENLFSQYEKDKAKPKALANNNIIMVTDLISFPTSLTTLLLTDGDYENNKLPLYININLKKFGCSGRGILTLKEPSATQKDKFYQLYDIHPSVPFNIAIMELGKIVQISLYFLGLLLTPKCDDGLMCDQTNTAINSYITIFGSFDTEIDSTIRDIIREIVDLKFKLHVLGYQSTKDPFQFPNNFERQIIAFKRNNGLRISGVRSAELDPDTIKHINTSYINSIASTKHKYKNVNEKNDMSFYFQHINIDRLRYLKSGKKKNINDNTKSMDNLKNIFSNSIMKLNDIKKNNSLQPSIPEKSSRRFFDIYNDNDFSDNEEIDDIYNSNVENDINETSEKENNVQVMENDNEIESINMEIIKSTDSINYLYHSKSMIETRTRQICEEMENFNSLEEILQMKKNEYENFIKDSMLIKKVDEYQNSKHNHSLNYLKLRKSKSCSDFFETRNNIEKNSNNVIKINSSSYNKIVNLIKLENSCKEKIDNIKLIIGDYSSIIENFLNVFNKRYDESKNIGNKITHIKENQSKLLETVQDVEMQNTRQVYDISTIEDKLKDMEELIEQFKNRVSKMVSQ
ncbi:hypothetical protein BCR36DRAFT_140130 [Piromyces finnis]|uniref:STB6-like N-terminal domain-containing protein n=1 Tax=Piromyces finnis TaxID=1754191 RepID=A0A1Y1UYY6_9FUNG|nr:hypothetical protein BCR36DRAFT_140130 [Piromyces finnis]|eukprot:ORX43754.1 hypothetical protein BCR36DRAFT_140130 [Piromyces finnis]